MSDWQEIKDKAHRITAKLRAVQPANILSDQGDLRPLADRLPRVGVGKRIARPGKVGLVTQPKMKKGNEISAAQMKQLKSGTMQVDAKLDLHGLTQVQAFRELGHFMYKQTARGARLLLIITGKGRDLKGVLRQQLPGWLMASEWTKYILTIHPAHLRHGGDGATYVLLRKIK